MHGCTRCRKIPRRRALISETATFLDFPPSSMALLEPNGLLAVGGSLNSKQLLLAYARGIFPWFQEGQPVLWWTPDPRAVLRPESFHASKSLRRFARASHWRTTSNKCFESVITACSKPRLGSSETWLTSSMRNAYTQLHKIGLAHSIEVFDGDELVGGLYGVLLGRVFFGESMFSVEANASKLALWALAVNAQKNHSIALIDCQIESAHLSSLGAISLSRSKFENQLHCNISCDAVSQGLKLIQEHGHYKQKPLIGAMQIKELV